MAQKRGEVEKVMANSVRLQCKLLQKVVKVFARQNGCPCPLCVRLVRLVG